MSGPYRISGLCLKLIRVQTEASSERPPQPVLAREPLAGPEGPPRGGEPPGAPAHRHYPLQEQVLLHLLQGPGEGTVDQGVALPVVLGRERDRYLGESSSTPTPPWIQSLENKNMHLNLR